MSEKSGYGVSFGLVPITYLDFADDAVILAETTEVFAEEAEALGLRVSWMETKVQAFADILDATIVSIPVSAENVEVTQTFT